MNARAASAGPGSESKPVYGQFVSHTHVRASVKTAGGEISRTRSDVTYTRLKSENITLVKFVFNCALGLGGQLLFSSANSFFETNEKSRV